MNNKYISRGEISRRVGEVQLLLHSAGFGVKFNGNIIDKAGEEGFCHFGKNTSESLNKAQFAIKDYWNALSTEERARHEQEFKKLHSADAEFNFNIDNKCGDTTSYFLRKLVGKNQPVITSKKIDNASAKLQLDEAEAKINESVSLLVPLADPTRSEYPNPQFLPLSQKAISQGQFNYLGASDKSHGMNAFYIHSDKSDSFGISAGSNQVESFVNATARHKNIEAGVSKIDTEQNKLEMSRVAVVSKLGNKGEIRTGAALVNNEPAAYLGVSTGAQGKDAEIYANTEVVAGKTHRHAAASVSARKGSTSIRGRIYTDNGGNLNSDATIAQALSEKTELGINGQYHKAKGQPDNWEVQPYASHKITKKTSVYGGATFTSEGGQSVFSGVVRDINDNASVFGEYNHGIKNEPNMVKVGMGFKF